jgi:hypothetical protein
VLSSRQIRSAALIYQRKCLLASPGGSDEAKRRRQLTPEFGSAVFYIFYALLDRADITTLAMFRYNCAGLNHRLHASGKHDTAVCGACPAEDESVRHVLLRCPRYSVARVVCAKALDAIRVTRCFAVLMGKAEDVHEDRRRRALRAVARFLSEVRRIRGL